MNGKEWWGKRNRSKERRRGGKAAANEFRVRLHEAEASRSLFWRKNNYFFLMSCLDSFQRQDPHNFWKGKALGKIRQDFEGKRRKDGM